MRPWGMLSQYQTACVCKLLLDVRGCETGCFSYGESPRTPPPEETSLHRQNNNVERPWGISRLFTTCFQPVSNQLSPVRGCDTDVWRHLCEAGRFSYGESPRTPPRKGTSLHRRNNVERPWGILSLFTTCLHVTFPCQRVWHRRVATPTWSRSFYLRWITADPSPWGS